MAGMFRELKAEEIDCRVQTCNGNGVSLLLYKDSRCDMNILDETVGAENWQRGHKELKNNIYCGVGINKMRNTTEPPQWIWKWDAGAESYTEKEKGEASDSFKRACVNWGIGRELYTSPFIWIDAKNLKKLEQDGRGNWKCKDNFVVRDIGYYDGAIDYLIIEDTSARALVYQLGDADPRQRIKKHFREYCAKHGLDEKEIASKYKITKESTVDDFKKVMEVLKNEC